MILTSSDYLKEFDDFLSVYALEEDVGDIDFEGALKYIDYKQYFIDDMFVSPHNNYTQNTIEDEVRAWRKFYLNNYKKESMRDFEPFLTQGDIANFIQSQLSYFVDRHSISGLGRLITSLGGDASGELAREEAAAIVMRLVNQRVRLLTGLPSLESLRQSADLINMIARSASNETIRQGILRQSQNFLLQSQQKLTAVDINQLITNGIPNILTNAIKRDKRFQTVDFFFQLLTGNDLRPLDDDSSILRRIKTRWGDFVRQNIFRQDRPVKPTDVFDIVLDVFGEMKKDVLMTRNIFQLKFRDVLIRAVNKRLNVVEFGTSVRSLFRTFGRDMFRGAIEQFGLDPKDYNQIERVIINRLTTFAFKKAGDLSANIISQGLTLSESLLKGEQWGNRILNKFFELGKYAADRNGLYEWVYGDTQHCGTCLAAHGQRHRLRDWWAAGIIPRNHGHKNLICGGYHCDCQLLKVTGKSAGRLDRIPVK